MKLPEPIVLHAAGQAFPCKIRRDVEEIVDQADQVGLSQSRST